VLGLLILPVGFYIRRKLPETLLAPRSRGKTQVLGTLLRDHWHPLLLVTLIVSSMTIGTYVVGYLTTYSITTLGMAPVVAMLAPLVQGGLGVSIAGWCGRLADRHGRRRVMLVSRTVSMLAIYPCFLLLVHERSAAALIGVTALFTVLGSPASIAAQVSMCEIFPNALRGAGMSLAYAFVVTMFGGTTQFALAWLIGVTGDPLAPAYYWIAFCLVSLCAIYLLRETRGMNT
jgi:MFS family permease